MPPSKTIDRAASLHRLWCALLLCITSFAPCSVEAFSWTCSLNFLPVEKIALTPSQQELLQNKADADANADDGGRYLRSWGRTGNEVLALPIGYVNRRISEDTIYNNDGINNTTLAPDDDAGGTAANVFDLTEKNNDHGNEKEENQNIIYLEGRLCACATGMLGTTDDQYYCPTPTDHCSVWRRRFDKEYGVTCFEEKGWTVGFARSTWYYLCFISFFLCLYPIFTRPGQHAVRYLLSRCFRKMNPWITEHILQVEIETNARIREEYEHIERLKRRTEGWITGYSLKTKRHSSVDVTADDDGGCNAITDHNDTNLCEDDTNSTDDGTAREARHDHCNVEDEEDYMCTICLLAVEDGERIADLSCRHLYHAECLSEWILKKNSCPLCQDEDIAKEIRSFETEGDAATEGNNSDSSNSKGMFSRLRGYARENLLDIATGRERRDYHLEQLRRSLAMAEMTDNTS